MFQRLARAASDEGLDCAFRNDLLIGIRKRRAALIGPARIKAIPCDRLSMAGSTSQPSPLRLKGRTSQTVNSSGLHFGGGIMYGVKPVLWPGYARFSSCSGYILTPFLVSVRPSRVRNPLK